MQNSNSTTWLRPLNAMLLQLMVFEHLAKERGAVLVVRGDLSELEIPDQFSCPMPGDGAVIGWNRRRAFLLNHQSWKLLCGALREDDWRSERLIEMEIFLGGVSAFLVGDSFHPECVSLRDAAPKLLVEKLVEGHAAALRDVA